MFSILAGSSKGIDITDILEAVGLVVATEVDVNTVADLDSGAAVTTEEDVDVVDVSIDEETGEVAGESVVTGSKLLNASAFQALL